MPLLLDEDYARLKEIGIAVEEDQNSRFLVFPSFPLLDGLYESETVDVLVVIPTNYNDDGIDCIWVKPYLKRKDGREIPRASLPGAGENHRYNGAEFCRWSRHWNKENNKWKAGVSNIDTILRRIQWALNNPDADK